MEFLSVEFRCKCCGKTAEIYFERDSFNFNQVREINSCSKCGTKAYCDVGDLGYRNDLADPDNPPWQLQVIKLCPSKVLCDICLSTNKKHASALDLIAWCELCDQESMLAVSYVISDNADLFSFLGAT